MSFNLVDEPFIPCILEDGRNEEFSLTGIFENATRIREIRDESPLVTAAIHRILLAILHRVIAGPKSRKEWAKVWKAGSFPVDQIRKYLNENRDCFDLLSESRPFSQDKTLHTSKHSPISRIAKELASGNNATLFDHTSIDQSISFPLKKVARLLIAEQSFAIGGGKSERGYTTSGPVIGGIFVLVLGENLFETLTLNLLVYNSDKPIVRLEDDAPSWETQNQITTESPRGYLDLLTWQSRALRLCVEEASDPSRITSIDYAQGRAFNPHDNFYEPFFPHRPDKDGVMRPHRFNTYRSLWRESGSLFAWARSEYGGILRHLSELTSEEFIPCSTRRKLAAIGVCNDKARVDFWRHEVMPLRTEYLVDEGLLQALQTILDLTEKVAGSLKWAGRIAAKETLKSGEGEPDKDRVSDYYESLAPDRLYWSRLETPFYRLLVDLPDAESKDNEIVKWFHDVLCPTAHNAFDKTFGQCDGPSRQLKAAAIGGRELRMGLGRLRPDKLTSSTSTMEA